MSQNHKLFIGSLPADITEEELKIVFSTYGEVVDINIVANSASKSKTGHCCAFLGYASRESAEDAIQVLDNQYKIREGGDEILPIRVSWPRPSFDSGKGKSSGKGYNSYGKDSNQGGGGGWQHGGGSHSNWQSGGAGKGNYHSGGGGGWQDNRRDNWSSSGSGWQDKPPYNNNSYNNSSSWSSGGGGSVVPDGRCFVGNLPADIDEGALMFVFGNYGKVDKVHIMVGRAKSGQACAFVEYSKPEEAEVAINTLNDKYEIRVGDGPIMVKHAGDRVKRPRPY